MHNRLNKKDIFKYSNCSLSQNNEHFRMNNELCVNCVQRIKQVLYRRFNVTCREI